MASPAGASDANSILAEAAESMLAEACPTFPMPRKVLRGFKPSSCLRTFVLQNGQLTRSTRDFGANDLAFQSMKLRISGSKIFRIYECTKS